MKLDGNVSAVRSQGGELKVTVFAAPIGVDTWRSPIELTLPNNSRTRAAYRVGRAITLDVTPRGAR